MKRLTSTLAAIALALLAFVPAASAEFGAVPGSTVGKAHEPVHLEHVQAGNGAQCCEIDLDAIKALEPAAAAGSHPDATGAGELLGSGGGEFVVRDFLLDAPPGFLGDPTAVPPCDRGAFFRTLNREEEDGCQPVSQVGVVTVHLGGLTPTRPIYRLTASPGSPASFGFPISANSGVVINARLRTDGDYGVTLASTEISSASGTVHSVAATLWGDPSSSFHDPDRFDPVTLTWGTPSGLPRVPLIQLPSDCSNASLLTVAHVRSWQEPGLWLPDDLPAGDPRRADYELPAPQPTGCDELSFEPEIALVPSATNSDSPTGVSVQMHIPQNEDPESRSIPQMKKAVVTLPEGLNFNPSAGDGLEGCSEAQIGLLTTNGAYPNPIRFAKGDANCPQASKIGHLTVQTPLLEEALGGDIYVAAPYANPFGTLGALYLVIRGPGFVVKVPGKVEFKEDGQLVSSFDYNPQLPFEDLHLDFFGGPRAPLATSPLCGTQTILTELTPWSAPQSGPPATPTRSYQADAGPGGAPCSYASAQRPFNPRLTAGTDSPIAGGSSALTMRLTRPDGDQPLAGLTVKPPLGFAATLKGIPYCSEAQLAQAASRGPNGGGLQERNNPSCPEASRIGSTLTGAGAGPTPLFTEGQAYLAGPYKGAPLSMAVITPALAGGTPGHPVFDLGVVVVRVALHVDPTSAQVTAIADPIPQSLEGIPLRIRDIRFALDRPGFGLNPTSCAEKLFAVSATGQDGATAELSNRFQVLECANLPFKPRTSIQLLGKPSRGSYQGVRAVVRPRPGDANISRTVVRFPHSAFVAQEHIRTVCTRVQFKAETCPKGSIYGKALAYSPLLDEPLKGNVYLRSSDHLLPDAVADLHGPASQPIRVEVAVANDSSGGSLRNTVESVPDAPVSYFRLQLFGKGKGLIVNSRNVCKGRNLATVAMGAHNGRRSVQRVHVFNKRCKAQRRRAERRRAKRKAHRQRLRASGRGRDRG